MGDTSVRHDLGNTECPGTVLMCVCVYGGGYGRVHSQRDRVRSLLRVYAASSSCFVKSAWTPECNAVPSPRFIAVSASSLACPLPKPLAPPSAAARYVATWSTPALKCRSAASPTTRSRFLVPFETARSTGSVPGGSTVVRQERVDGA